MDHFTQHKTPFSPRVAGPVVLGFLAVALLAGVGASRIAGAQEGTTATTTPSCTLEAIPQSVTPGSSSTLYWTSEGADSVAFDGATTTFAASVGTMSVSPANTTTYTGTFAGPGGSVNCSATVVVDANLGTSIPSIDFGAVNAPDTAVVNPPAPSVTAAPSQAIQTTPLILPPSGTTPAPIVLEAASDGSVLIRGTVLQSGINSITIASWGGTWTIRSGDGTAVIPAGPSSTSDLSLIPVGNLVGVEGTVALGAPFTVDATLIRDWTTNPYTGPELATTTEDTTADFTDTEETNFGTSSLDDGAPTLEAEADDEGAAPSSEPVPPLYTGTARNIGDNTFTLNADDGNSYTVNLADGALVWNEARLDMPFENIEDGDSIRLNGNLGANGEITATVVRDTSR